MYGHSSPPSSGLMNPKPLSLCQRTMVPVSWHWESWWTNAVGGCHLARAICESTFEKLVRKVGQNYDICSASHMILEEINCFRPTSTLKLEQVQCTTDTEWTSQGQSCWFSTPLTCLKMIGCYPKKWTWHVFSLVFTLMFSHHVFPLLYFTSLLKPSMGLLRPLNSLPGSLLVRAGFGLGPDDVWWHQQESRRYRNHCLKIFQCYFMLAQIKHKWFNTCSNKWFDKT